jgi:hypothetical protein
LLGAASIRSSTCGRLWLILLRLLLLLLQLLLFLDLAILHGGRAAGVA